MNNRSNYFDIATETRFPSKMILEKMFFDATKLTQKKQQTVEKISLREFLIKNTFNDIDKIKHDLIIRFLILFNVVSIINRVLNINLSYLVESLILRLNKENIIVNSL